MGKDKAVRSGISTILSFVPIKGKKTFLCNLEGLAFGDVKISRIYLEIKKIAS